MCMISSVFFMLKKNYECFINYYRSYYRYIQDYYICHRYNLPHSIINNDEGDDDICSMAFDEVDNRRKI